MNIYVVRLRDMDNKTYTRLVIRSSLALPINVRINKYD